MNFNQQSTGFYYVALLYVIILCLMACSPALYKGPAMDFRAASVTLRDAYFLELSVANKARIERGDIGDQVQIWTAPANVSSTELDRISATMAKRRQESMHEQLRRLREQAFNTLYGYASTLVSLASDEPTDRIKSELAGLGRDIGAALEAAEKINLIGDKFQKFGGPLQQYVGVLNEIIGLVSDVLREKVIIETIGKSNESIVALLNILKDEANEAMKDALRQTIAATDSIDSYMSHQKFQKASNEIKAEVVKRKAKLVASREKIEAQDITSVFEAALKAQGALVQKAMLKNPGDWTIRIKRFKQQVETARTTIEEIKSAM